MLLESIRPGADEKPAGNDALLGTGLCRLFLDFSFALLEVVDVFPKSSPNQKLGHLLKFGIFRWGHFLPISDKNPIFLLKIIKNLRPCVKIEFNAIASEKCHVL